MGYNLYSIILQLYVWTFLNWTWFRYQFLRQHKFSSKFSSEPFFKKQILYLSSNFAAVGFWFFYLFSSLVLFPSWIGFFTGDIVGCYLNIEDEKVIFSLNGDSLPPFNHLFKTAKYVSQHGYNVLWKLMKC